MTIKLYLMVRDSDSMILGCMGRDDPDYGPITQQQLPPAGVTLVDDPAAAAFSRDGHSDTEVAHWVDGVVTWLETISLTDAATRNIAAIDAEGDAARLSVIGDPTKALEYQRAESQARPYAAAGYPDPAPSTVASWANAKRWTNGGVPWTGQQAADDIIATADRWYAGLDGIRDLRLDAKQHIEAIASDPEGTPAQVAAVLAQFRLDLANLMKGLA